MFGIQGVFYSLRKGGCDYHIKDMRELCIKKLTREAQDIEKSNKMWDKRAREFAENIKKQTSDVFMDFIRQRVDLPNQHFLDIGSGAGKYIKLLLDEGALVDAVEPSVEMVAQAKKYLAESGHDEANYSIFNQAFQDFQPTRKYDYVLLSNSPVISFYENYHKILSLATKGILITSWIGERDSLLERVCEELGKKAHGHNGQSIRYVFELLLEDGYFPSFESKFQSSEEEVDTQGWYHTYAGWIFGEDYTPQHVEEIRQIVEKEMKDGKVKVRSASAQAMLYVDLTERLSVIDKIKVKFVNNAE